MRLVKSTETLEKNEKKLLYMCNARPVLKMRALFSDATKDYRNPPECDPGDSVALRPVSYTHLTLPTKLEV